MVSGVDQRQENKADTGQAPAATERKIAVLGPTLRFKGDLSAEEDFILQGRIQGSIHHTQSIIIGTGGSVAGTIYARMVVVDGSVEGDLYGTEAVVVHETGRVAGNIFAPRVGIAEGAVFNGRIDMTGASSAGHGVQATTSQTNAHSGAQPAAHPAAQPGAHAGTSQSGIHRRIESPTMSPGRPLSAEETERVLAQKAVSKAAPKATPKVVTVLPPPPRREQAG